MLGWHISTYRQENDRAEPATAQSAHGTRLTVWQATSAGLDWIEQLVRDGKAVLLGGDGDPVSFTAKAQHVIPQLLSGPPEARENWISDSTDVLLKGWEGKTVIDRAAVEACTADEWLLVEAFDES